MPILSAAPQAPAYQPLAENNAELEVRAFARVISQLEAADRTNKMSMVPALHENQRLWAFIQGQVSSSDNALPPELRARLMALSFWMERHTEAILAGLADVQAIIDVNQLVMSGLEMQVQRKTALQAA